MINILISWCIHTGQSPKARVSALLPSTAVSPRRCSRSRRGEAEALCHHLKVQWETWQLLPSQLCCLSLLPEQIPVAKPPPLALASSAVSQTDHAGFLWAPFSNKVMDLPLKTDRCYQQPSMIRRDLVPQGERSHLIFW